MMRTDAYRQFKQRLFSGDLRPGQFVSQRELADLIGVPLMPIREAIRQLECEQLIKVFPKRGIQVIEIDPTTINDGYDYRLLLEKEAIGVFAEHAPSDLIASLRKTNRAALKKLEGSTPDGEKLKEIVDAAWDFHEAIIDFQGNKIVSHHYRLNSARIRLARLDIHEFIKCLEPAFRTHIAILDACAKRDVKEATRLIVEDIETSRAMALGIKPGRKGARRLSVA